MDWATVGTFAVAGVAFISLNFAMMQWLFTRRDSARTEASKALSELERDLLKLRAELPVDYVRREDWIRFSNTLEAKLDAMRAEVRAEISDLRGNLTRREAMP
jgi:hypothetical protein